MKHFATYLLFKFLLVSSVVCVGEACSSSTQKESPLTPEARIRGEETAKWIIDVLNKEKSQLKREGAILRVKATQSEYILAGDTIASLAFDESFANYLRQNNDSIANIIL
ncbi:MAG: hypothetical protein J1F10_03820 [Muribaculaceae bacterium]|nr:hypothetical protein [Muribaculaceae bacterium]